MLLTQAGLRPKSSVGRGSQKGQGYAGFSLVEYVDAIKDQPEWLLSSTCSLAPGTIQQGTSRVQHLFERPGLVPCPVRPAHNIDPDAPFPPLQGCIIHQLPRLGTCGVVQHLCSMLGEPELGC